MVKRTLDRKAPVSYHVTDKLPPKTSKDWERVVACFVHGVGWQVSKGFQQPKCFGVSSDFSLSALSEPKYNVTCRTNELHKLVQQMQLCSHVGTRGFA